MPMQSGAEPLTTWPFETLTFWSPSVGVGLLRLYAAVQARDSQNEVFNSPDLASLSSLLLFTAASSIYPKRLP